MRSEDRNCHNTVDTLDGMIKIKGKCGFQFIGGCKDLRQQKAKLREIKEIIENFATIDILTSPDFTVKQNYEWIASQYAQPIKEIWKLLQEDNQ